MKKTTFAPVLYTPGPVPTDLPASAQRYLDNELNRIASLLQIMASRQLKGDTLTLTSASAPPTNPAPGEEIYTDATVWDPGSGEGKYYLNSHGQWTPLG